MKQISAEFNSENGCLFMAYIEQGIYENLYQLLDIQLIIIGIQFKVLYKSNNVNKPAVFSLQKPIDGSFRCNTNQRLNS